jgi:peptidoglycan/LPS O-acetylase OafA/YrhL
MPQYYVLFVVGVIAAAVAHGDNDLSARLRALPIWRSLAAISTALWVALVLGMGWDTFVATPLWYELPWGAAIFCVLIMLSVEGTVVRKVLESKPLLRAGHVSYSLYLLHWMPVSVCAMWLSALPMAHAWPLPLHFLVLLGMALPVSLLLATGSYWLFERPYLRERGAPRTRQATAVPVSMLR